MSTLGMEQTVGVGGGEGAWRLMTWRLRAVHGKPSGPNCGVAAVYQGRSHSRVATLFLFSLNSIAYTCSNRFWTIIRFYRDVPDLSEYQLPVFHDRGTIKEDKRHRPWC